MKDPRFVQTESRWHFKHKSQGLGLLCHVPDSLREDEGEEKDSKEQTHPDVNH